MKAPAVKEPIALSSILEYYMDEQTLKRPRTQLIAEMKDLLTISQFLQARIPITMKNIKQSMRVQQKSVKELSDNIKKYLSSLSQEPDNTRCYYLETAYKMMSHFGFNKEADNDFVEKTMAEKEMKLKFMQAENLPQDFTWHKPVKNHRQPSGHRPGYDVTWAAHFNPKYSMIQIPARKYSVYVSLSILEGKYVWEVADIKKKGALLGSDWLKEYFARYMRPAIKQKFGARSEENMLACIHDFVNYFELLELQITLAQLSKSKQQFSEEISLEHNNQIYTFKFTKPEHFKAAIVAVRCQSRKQFVLQFVYSRASISAKFMIENIQFISCSEFVYQNAGNLIEQLEQLTECGERLLKFHNKTKEAVFDFEHDARHFFMLINGIVWVHNSTEQLNIESYRKINQEGIFIGIELNQNVTFLSLAKNGQLESRRISKVFLNKLLLHIPHFRALLAITRVIEQILASNNHYNNESQLQYYKLSDDNKVVLYFLKRQLTQEKMARSSKINHEEDTIFLASRVFTLTMNLHVTEAKVTMFREIEKPVLVPVPDDISSSQMQLQESVARIVAGVRKMQEYGYCRYIVEKRFKREDSATRLQLRLQF